MRLRIRRPSLRMWRKTVTRKQKMDSRRRGKRKSPSQDIIFEVSDNDISSENSEDDCQEPEAKISKVDGSGFRLKLSQFSNLQAKETANNVEVSPSQESENSVEISEHISVSNSSAPNSCESESDIIVISEDNIDVLNDSEEYYVAPRAESIENSDKSVDSNEIIDITDENPPDLASQSPPCISLNENSQVPVINEGPDTSTDDYNAVTLTVTGQANLEEGEVDDTQNDVQIDEPIDVTKSPSIEIDAQQEIEDETDSGSNPCILINFSDEKIAELYKLKFLKFLQQFVELEVESSAGLTVKVQRDTMLNPAEWVVLDETMCLNETKEIDPLDKPELPPVVLEKSPKKKKKKRNKKEKELFILDTNPSQNENGMQFTKYSTRFLIDINDKTSAEDDTTKVSAQTCFNCDSNHAIKDCPLPKDFVKINAARQRFKAQKQTA